MAMVQPISAASGAATDRVLAALVAGLEREFGRDAGEALAHRFLDAEEAEFLWEARDQERWIGSYEGADSGADVELDRVRIVGRLAGCWYVAMMIVDGDGNLHGMLGKRSFGYRLAAMAAFADA
ncbi:hypothetical protein SAMN03159338_2804 [Sphingomonas sp. NFR04]|uniref:hypothetical protein n=1 Tax=Sphingomonas sp. NFR04 TaxID=1566283 RepID=UPI0008E08899|nr:hypothetical protein [Sphingomonas sp. NFR04]SFJ97324.1 hypothetical protein SAMN03159338_2804 [Sphingomonas sp. NFR04]